MTPSAQFPLTPYTLQHDLQMKGEDWIKTATSGVLLVPSVIVPSEANILINPVHPDASKIHVLARNPFTLDPRLFR